MVRSTLGWSSRREGGVGGQRHGPHRHLVVQRLAHRQGARRCTDAASVSRSSPHERRTETTARGGGLVTGWEHVSLIPRCPGPETGSALPATCSRAQHQRLGRWSSRGSNPDKDRPVRHPRRTRTVDRQAPSRALARRLGHPDHLLVEQPSRARHAPQAAGPGSGPTRQSVLVDRWGRVTGSNHAKWMTTTGAWGSSTADHVTLSGSANWSSAAFSNDEQMQLIRDVTTARPHVRSFDVTWRQRSTRSSGREVVGWSVRAE